MGHWIGQVVELMGTIAAMIVALILPQRSPDRVAIRPQLHHDRGSYSSLVCRPMEIR